MYNQKRLSVDQAAFFLALSLFLNAFGNGLTIACNLGSAMWTASATNIANVFHFSIGNVLIVYGMVQILMNICLVREIDFHRIIGNLVFIFCFGPLVSVFSSLFKEWRIFSWPLWATLSLDIIGLLLICVAISLYQRVNLILHPGDEMTSILRFKYFAGNPKKAQFVNFLIPLVVILICLAISKNLVAVNIGTLVSFFSTGTLIGLSDKYIFPKLTHKVNY